MKITAPVGSWRITKTNGRSRLTLRIGSGSGAAPASKTMAVAAAASVPDSSTLTQASWTTSEIFRSKSGQMPWKSAASEKATPMPKVSSMGFRLYRLRSSKLGIASCVGARVSAARAPASVASVSESSNARRSPTGCNARKLSSPPA